MKNRLLIWMLVGVMSSCAVNRYQPSRKFSPQELQKDYAVFRGSLEESHPSLYWYTPKDSMDFYFSVGQSKLSDSLTELQFRNVLSYVLSKVRCGHTTVRPSKAAARITGQNSPFPLYIKAWPDTAVVTANINRSDSGVYRGMVLTSINNRPIGEVVDSLFSFLATDGYNLSHKYQTLSNGSTFRNLYTLAFRLKENMPVEYIDSTGSKGTTSLSLFKPKPDSATQGKPSGEKPSRKERHRQELQAMRNLRFDTALNTAYLEVNTFTKGYHLRSFFKNAFREIEEKGVTNLVVDVRGNGGGSVILSNLLTKYIADSSFSIADSLYAVQRGSAFARYRNSRFFNWLFLQFLTKKKQDGKYHFRFFENKAFKPKTKYHFTGTTYIVTGGNTFSAAALFAQSLRHQKNVVLVGEETGGGAYGNSAWLIPDVTLPHTGVRFRLPLFRLVIDKQAEKGKGVEPHVPALPTVEAIRQGIDYKMEKVRELIRLKNH